jgi:hypothetical protein
LQRDESVRHTTRRSGLILPWDTVFEQQEAKRATT